MSGELMSLEEIDQLQIACGNLDMPFGKFNHVCDTARAAHTARDDALEEAAQVVENTVVSKPVWGTKPETHNKPATASLTRIALAKTIRALKGSSHD